MPSEFASVGATDNSENLTSEDRHLPTITHSSCVRAHATLKAGNSFCKPSGAELSTAGIEGQMLQRVMAELMGMKTSCPSTTKHPLLPRKPDSDDEEQLKGDERKEAEKRTRKPRSMDPWAWSPVDRSAWARRG